MTISRVFLIEPPNNDSMRQRVKLLEKYGNVVELFGRTKPVSIWDTVAFQEAIFDQLDRYRFNTTTDFVALQGGSLLLALLISTVKEYANGAAFLGLAYNPANGGGYSTVLFSNSSAD